MTNVRAERSGQVGSLIIDNPDRRNAMTRQMYADVPQAVEQLVAGGDLRCVILRGAGNEAFCAGSDVSEFKTQRTANSAADYAGIEHRAFGAIAELSTPTIAAIHGPCMGGGVALATSCDLRIAADDATFSVPPGKLGVGYAVDGAQNLARLIGVPQAKMLLLTACVIDAAEALRIGLVNQVVAKDHLDEHVHDLTQRISQLAPLTLTAAKLALDHRPEAHDAVRACFASADYREGIASFEQKRRPSFEGR
ncbi:MAG: enoyl-CoA hydratase-related protein [Acidimicrobiia bacterium]|nr:enoyl-CoA hydratase-related protein [Acidimicrobiia bacterium]